MKQYGETFFEDCAKNEDSYGKMEKRKRKQRRFKLNALFCSTVKRDIET